MIPTEHPRVIVNWIYISDLDLFYKDPNADPDPAPQVLYVPPQKSVPTVFRGIWS